MNPQSNPDERFNHVESTLEQLSNSFRHLLTAQVLMHDTMSRTDTVIKKLSDAMLALAESQKQTDEKISGLTDKLDALTDKLDALTDIVRKWYERHGNGAASH